MDRGKGTEIGTKGQGGTWTEGQEQGHIFGPHSVKSSLVMKLSVFVPTKKKNKHSILNFCF